MNLSVKEGACGEHDGACGKANTKLRHRADNPVTFDDQVVTGLREQGQIRLVFQTATDRLLVQHAVGLRARRTHGRTLARIEDAKLDACLVGRCCHRAVERVDFLDQMALADAADRGVATHRAERVEAVREQQRLDAHARAGKRCFGAGMAATDHDHVEAVRKLHGKSVKFGCAEGMRILRQSAEK